jgi:hypothetical protein
MKKTTRSAAKSKTRAIEGTPHGAEQGDIVKCIPFSPDGSTSLGSQYARVIIADTPDPACACVSVGGVRMDAIVQHVAQRAGVSSVPATWFGAGKPDPVPLAIVRAFGGEEKKAAA